MHPPLPVPMRRALVSLFLLAIAAAAAWTVFRWDPKDRSASDPWRALPDQAAVIIEVPDAWRAWDRFTQSSMLWRHWESRPSAKALGDLIARANQRAETDGAFAKALGNGSVLVAIARTGAGKADVLYASAIDEDDATAMGAFLGLDPQSQKTLDGNEIVSVQIDGAKQPMHLVIRGGIWLASMSRELIDEALLQLEKGSVLFSDPAFNKARSTLGAGMDAHVLIHPARAKGALNAWWMPERLDRYDLPEGWAALDLRVQPDAILLSGLMAGAEAHSLYRSIHEQGNGAWNIARVLPASVSEWNVRNVSDASTIAIAPEEALFSWAHGAVGMASAFDQNGTATRWLVMEAGDVEDAEDELTRTSGMDTLSYRGSRISHMAEAMPWETLMGVRAELPQQPWWTILGRTILMSDDASALQMSIDAWNDGNSLAMQKRTADWLKRQSREAAFTWWFDPARALPYFREDMRADADSAFMASQAFWSAHGNACVQISAAANGLLHVGIALQGLPGETAQPTEGDVLWSVDLGAPALGVPQFVVNHTNNLREVLVQDSLFRIHLISTAGKVLWTRELDGPILGVVHQVDRFKNGKLQLLFNTARTGYLIDRNGRDVGTPFKIPGMAAAPLSVFDYEGTKDYRILLADSTGRIQNVDIDWATVEGWASPKLPSPAVAPVEHLRIRGKDYLLAIGSDGSIALFDRKGNVRETIATKLDRVKEVHEVITGTEILSTRIRWTDQDLVLHETTIGGAVVQTIPADGGRNYFLTIDGKETIARIAADSLILSSGKEIRSAGHGAYLEPLVIAHERRGDPAIIAVVSREGKCWLHNADGSVLAGMPVEGSRSLALGELNSDGVTDLVIAAGKRITLHKVSRTVPQDL